MPSVSIAQNRWWHHVEENPGSYPAATVRAGKDFLTADQGRSLKNLPQHKAQGGAVYPKPFAW